MLGQRIRQLRQSRGLTQADLAGNDVSKGYISLIEKGVVKPSLETLQAIAFRLGTSVDALLGGDRLPAHAATTALLALAEDALRQRDFVRADQLLQAVRYVAQTYGIDEGTREALLMTGAIEVELRRFDEALWTAQRVRKLAEDAHDHWRLGRALLLEGRIRVRQRRFDDASRTLAEALRLLRKARAGRDPARIEALIALGTALFYQGNLRGARRRYREAARSHVARHNPVLRGRAYWGLGLVYRKAKAFTEAEAALAEARRAFEAAEELQELVRVLENFAHLFYDTGRYVEALKHLHHALRVTDRLKMKPVRAKILTEIGRIHVTLGNPQEAEHFANQAAAIAREVGDPVEVAEATVVLARVVLARGDRAAGLSLLRQALATFKEHSMTARAEQTSLELAHALEATEEARTLPPSRTFPASRCPASTAEPAPRAVAPVLLTAGAGAPELAKRVKGHRRG
ncbi:MAG: tetratricopeptide repeat protein [Armatimonadota bacterium]|nr:tetratricopeptide repeat protein [Armatimonadota bacterium]MDR7492513.1 tetratricopeptide repeat protein [Armatimonadota bacterium]MDR7502666.1 tetratricopeptide repeat protein [Armatimonadota bacterium]MDR7574483.1 tetratricopeptide repeat protein [Armatimonadota bacterium]